MRRNNHSRTGGCCVFIKENRRALSGAELTLTADKTKLSTDAEPPVTWRT